MHKTNELEKIEYAIIVSELSLTYHCEGYSTAILVQLVLKSRYSYTSVIQCNAIRPRLRHHPQRAAEITRNNNSADNCNWLQKSYWC